MSHIQMAAINDCETVELNRNTANSSARLSISTLALWLWLRSGALPRSRTTGGRHHSFFPQHACGDLADVDGALVLVVHEPRQREHGGARRLIDLERVRRRDEAGLKLRQWRRRCLTVREVLHHVCGRHFCSSGVRVEGIGGRLGWPLHRHRGVRARLRLQVPRHRVRLAIALCQGAWQVEQLTNGCEDRRVVVHGRIHDAFADVRGHDHRGHTNTQPFEIERRRDRDQTVRIHRRWRRHVIEDAAVLVMQHEQQARVPERGLAERFVDVGDEVLAQTHVVRRMLIVRLAIAKS